MAEIRNRHVLEKAFGRWPTFHDAEVIEARLKRGKQAQDAPSAPTIELDIHVFEMTDQVSAQGAYVHQNHTLVTLRFNAVDQVRMEDFNQQNVLFDLEMSSDQENVWAVDLQSSYGLGGSFTCEQIEVVKAVPFEPPDRFSSL